MKNIACLCVYFIVLPVYVIAQDCSCNATFDWGQEKLALNYAGYQDKVNDENRAAFVAHTERIQAAVASITNDEDCLRLLLEWSAWFKDGHVQLSRGAVTGSPEEIRARYANWPSIAMNEEAFRNYLDVKGEVPAIEGIWQSVGSNYKIGIIKNNDISSTVHYQAFILQADSVWWMPGQVKMELTETAEHTFAVGYFMRNHSRQEQTAVVENETLLKVSNLGSWYQVYPRSGSAPADDATQNIYSLEQLDEEILLLTLPTMNEAYRKDLQQLMKEKKEMLETTPYWIIDCCGNGGGSDVTYYPLLSYLATGDVELDGMKTWATADNAEKYLALRHDKNFSWITRLWAGRMGRKMLRNTGEFIGSDKCTHIDKYRKVTDYPKRVAVLIDGGCGSSCEQFVLFADQSDKVSLMGQPSAGVLDYGNLTNQASPCGNFSLNYPTSRSCRVDEGRGIDNVGIPPDLELSLDGEDWIEVAK